jgi:uroporphyrinogen decarboxylase
MSLSPRQRVLVTINHEMPDRVPIIIGTSNTTTLKMRSYQKVKEKLGIKVEDKYLYDWPELGSAALDEQTLIRLSSDARGVLNRFPEETYQRNQDRPKHTPFIDDWGIGQIEIEPGVWFPGLHPLASATTLEDLERYPWPDVNDLSRNAGVREQSKNLAEDDQFAIIATPWLLFPFERAIGLMGMENFLPKMVGNPEFAIALLTQITDLCKSMMGHFLAELGSNVDMVKIGDDLGTQAGLMISPKMYRELLKPLHADYIKFIKENTNAKVFFHTDGDVFDLVDDFIEIGVDILNPIQTSAGKMANLEALKKRYGDDLIFCGAIDTQNILPYGSPDQVRQEVRRVINTLGPGGGYILASVHTIMDEVPPENILAIVDAVEEFGYYPLRD